MHKRPCREQSSCPFCSPDFWFPSQETTADTFLVYPPKALVYINKFTTVCSFFFYTNGNILSTQFVLIFSLHNIAQGLFHMLTCGTPLLFIVVTPMHSPVPGM